MRPELLCLLSLLCAAPDALTQPGAPVPLSSGPDDRAPAIAYAENQDVYLAVWERVTGLAVEIVGQRYQAGGALVGAPVVIAGSGGAPTVGYVRARDRFVVAWKASFSEIRAATVDPGTGAVSVSVPVAERPNFNYVGPEFPALASNVVATDPAALLVWGDTHGAAIVGLSDVFARRLTVTAAGAIVAGPQVTVARGNWIGAPSVSRDGGQDGRYLIAYSERFNSSLGGVRANVRAVHADLSMSSVLQLDVGSRMPAVDGDGRSWVLAYEQAIGNDLDIYANRLVYDAANNALRTVVVAPVANDPGDLETRPQVAWLQDSCLVAFDDGPSGPDDGLFVRSIDQTDCRLCQGTFRLAPSAASTGSGFYVVSLAPRRRGGLSGDDVSIAWAGLDAQQARLVQAVAFRAVDGVATNLGGGCGVLGGVARATCARVGNIGFQHRLRDAQPGGAAVLVLGTVTGGFGCGPCSLVPVPVASVVTQIDAFGHAAVPMPVPRTPSLVGTTLFEQWLTVGAGCAAFGVDLSDALSVRLQ